MAVPKQARELAPHIPAGEEFAHGAKRQFVHDNVFQQGRARTLGGEAMGVIPMAKWTRDLDVAELAAFDIIAMLKNPANSKRSHSHAQDTAITIADSGGALLHFQVLPGGSEPLKSPRLGVPAKNNFGGSFDPGLRGEFNRMRHFLMMRRAGGATQAGCLLRYGLDRHGFRGRDFRSGRFGHDFHL